MIHTPPHNKQFSPRFLQARTQGLNKAIQLTPLGDTISIGVHVQCYVHLNIDKSLYTPLLARLHISPMMIMYITMKIKHPIIITI